MAVDSSRFRVRPKVMLSGVTSSTGYSTSRRPEWRSSSPCRRRLSPPTEAVLCHEGATVKVVLASGNAGKLRELDALLRPLGFELISQAALGVPAAEETGATFAANALLKARHAS